MLCSFFHKWHKMNRSSYMQRIYAEGHWIMGELLYSPLVRTTELLRASDDASWFMFSKSVGWATLWWNSVILCVCVYVCVSGVRDQIRGLIHAKYCYHPTCFPLNFRIFFLVTEELISTPPLECLLVITWIFKNPNYIYLVTFITTIVFLKVLCHRLMIIIERKH